jgi:hypothetical protein
MPDPLTRSRIVAILTRHNLPSFHAGAAEVAGRLVELEERLLAAENRQARLRTALSYTRDVMLSLMCALEVRWDGETPAAIDVRDQGTACDAYTLAGVTLEKYGRANDPALWEETNPDA